MGANFSREDRGKQLLARVVALQRKIMSERLGVEASLDLIVEQARQFTHADGSDIVLREGDELLYRAAAGSAKGDLQARLPLVSATRRCVLDGKVLRFDDSEKTDSSAALEDFRRIDVRSVIAVPVHQTGTVVGWLEVISSSTDVFTHQDVHALQLLSPLVTLALAQDAESRIYRKLSSERGVLQEIVTTLGVIEQLSAKKAEQAMAAQTMREPASLEDENHWTPRDLQHAVATIRTRAQALWERLSNLMQRYHTEKRLDNAEGGFGPSTDRADNPISSADSDGENEA